MWRFLATALVCTILLSVAWLWAGLVYSELVLNVASPFLPHGLDGERQGHDLLFAVSYLKPGVADGPLQLHTLTMRFHSMLMSYGIIVAGSVLLAAPGLRLRHRGLLLGAALALALLAHAAGLAVLVNHFRSVVLAGGTAEDTYLMQRLLTWAWLFIPSLVWLPVLLGRIRTLARDKAPAPAVVPRP